MLTNGRFVYDNDFFADYMADSVEVYNDAYTIPAGSYANTGGTNPFGPTVFFSTPYLFDPSNQGLMLYLSHSGYEPSNASQPYFARGDYIVGTQTALYSKVGNQLQGNTTGGAYIVRFITAPIPVPASAMMLVLSASSLLRRRR